MRISGLLATAFLVWALALGFSVRAHPAGLVVHSSQPATAPAAEDQALTNNDCFDCHEDESTRADGRPIAALKRDIYAASVHGEVDCVDCHADLAKAELPHDEKLQKVDCATCHSDETDLYKISAHAKARSAGSEVAASCVDCHGTHDTKPSTDPQSLTHHLQIAGTCARCHGNADLIARGGIPRGVTDAFADSIHGTVLKKSGLVVAPTCSSCHGAHDVRDPGDPSSRVAAPNVVDTCGTCHEGIARQFHGGVHAKAMKAGDTGAPACQTCHTAHGIQRVENAAWQLSVINQCGTCHADRIATFRDTFHGQVTTLGSRSVAGCADCHGAHEVLPASDPRSPIAPANLVKTCGACHANATPNFVQYDPHADKNDRTRNPALYYTSKFMTLLLAGVFGLFGLHSALWLGKEIRLKRERVARARERGR